MSTEKELDQLFGLLRAIKRQYRAELIELGIDLAPMHLKVLKMVQQRSGCTAQAIAAASGRDKAQIARLVHTLRQAGYVRRVENPDDRRSQLIDIDTAGSKVLQETAAIHRRIVSTMTRGLSKADQTVFFSVVQQFRNNLAR
ncbi:MAG: MarR family winged helix-turn-helix transcriptional regulator [Pseudomonadota bacterium]